MIKLLFDLCCNLSTHVLFDTCLLHSTCVLYHISCNTNHSGLEIRGVERGTHGPIYEEGGLVDGVRRRKCVRGKGRVRKFCHWKGHFLEVKMR